MNEWTSKSARLGSRAGHQFTATRTPSQFSETPRSGRIRTGEKGELVHGEVFKSSRANPGSFACQQLAPLAFRTERYTHTQPLALAEVVISWDKQAVPQRKYNFCDLQVWGEEVGRTAPEGRRPNLTHSSPPANIQRLCAGSPAQCPLSHSGVWILALQC